MARKKRAERIGSVLDRVLKKLGIEKQLKERTLFGVWEEEVGAEIARHAQPAHIKNGRLTVSVEGSVYVQEYSFLKKDLIKKLNGRLGKPIVKEIVFRPGPLDGRGLPEKTKKT